MGLTDPFFQFVAAIVATAIVAPLVSHWLGRRPERRAQLVAEISFHRFALPKTIGDILDEYRRSSMDPKDPRYKTATYYGYSALAEFVLINKSRRRLNRVTVVFPSGNSWDVAQVGTEETVQVVPDKPLEVGDLQPGHTITVKLWSYHDWGARLFFRPEKSFRFSADELDRVHIKLPVPMYLTEKYTIWPRWIGQVYWFIQLAVLPLALLVLIVMGIAKFFGV